MTLEELEVYRLAMDIGERVWAEVVLWDFFAKDTVGKQLVRAADSVAANLSEGFGRFHFKENKQYGYYSRGSLFETKTWLTKAAKRNLIAPETHAAFERDLNQLGRILNAYIKSIGTGPQIVRESGPEWNEEVISHSSFVIGEETEMSFPND
jgi:four helix bundle protein